MPNSYRYSLKELKIAFEEAEIRIESFRTKPADLMLTKPGPKSWSPAEVCRHLVEFGTLYLEQMEMAIASARPVPQRDGPFRPRWTFRLMARLFEPPYKMKINTLQMFTPDGDLDIRKTLDDLADIQEDILHILDQAESGTWNLKKIKGVNPAITFLTMSLIDLLVLMEVHQRRHFWQISQIFKAADLPDEPGYT